MATHARPRGPALRCPHRVVTASHDLVGSGSTLGQCAFGACPATSHALDVPGATMPHLKVRLHDLVRTDRQIRRALGGSGAPAGRQSPDLVCRPVRVAALAGTGDRGCLVLSDGQIAAVLVRIEAEDELQDGSGTTATAGWFLEAGFGRCAARVLPLFGSLAEALAWVRWRLAAGDAAGCGPPDAARAVGQPGG